MIRHITNSAFVAYHYDGVTGRLRTALVDLATTAPDEGGTELVARLATLSDDQLQAATSGQLMGLLAHGVLVIGTGTASEVEARGKAAFEAAWKRQVEAGGLYEVAQALLG